MTETQIRAGAGTSAAAARRERPGLVLGLVLTGQFMALVDLSVVNVAVPSIRADLHASGAALQLVIAGYSIAYAVMLITGARLGERRGFSRVFRWGLALFTLASLACGLAPDAGSLIGFRFAQGVGASLMVPQVMSIVQRVFTGQARVKALGVYTAVLAVGGVTGQVVGGLLVSGNLFGWDWRPAFLINVPIGAVLMAAAVRLLPDFAGNPERRLDRVGLVLLAAGMGLLVVPLVLGHEEHWPAWCWVLLGLSAVVFAAFVGYERRVEAAGGSPLIHRRVLGSPGLAQSGLAILLIMFGVSGYSFALALHLQAGLGDSPLRAGLAVAPMMAGFGLSGLYWQKLPARWHLPLPAVALVVVAAGFGVTGLLLRGGGGVDAGVLVVFFLLGLVCGCCYSPLFARALGRVTPAHAADASGVLATLLQLGQVLGVAVLGTLFLSEVSYPARAAVSGAALAVTAAACGVLMLAASASAHAGRRALARHPAPTA